MKDEEGEKERVAFGTSECPQKSHQKAFIQVSEVSMADRVDREHTAIEEDGRGAGREGEVRRWWWWLKRRKK